MWLISSASVDSSIALLQTDVAALQTDVATLQGDVTALQARKQVTGGYTACAGVPTNAVPLVCVINIGAAVDAITVTPVGVGSNLKVGLTADPTGLSSVTVNVYGSGAGSAVSGLSWTAVLQ
ncbi:MAG: hypothetical protein ACE5DX_04260 [Candidatus Dojkabacteria bacterium]